MPEQMTTEQLYDHEAALCRFLMKRKNADYGDSWLLMRPPSITDQILTKIMRIRELESLAAKGEAPKISEGIESELMDICNYALFELIQIRLTNQPEEVQHVNSSTILGNLK